MINMKILNYPIAENTTKLKYILKNVKFLIYFLSYINNSCNSISSALAMRFAVDIVVSEIPLSMALK